MTNTYSVHSHNRTSYMFLGVKMTILLSSKETGGQFSLIEGVMPPGGDGGLHVHTKEDESMHLLAGELEFTIGDRVFMLQAGESYFAPRDVPQRLRNLGNLPARAILLTTPGGFGEFIACAASPFAEGAEETSAPTLSTPTASTIHDLLDLAARYGIVIVEPPACFLA